MRDFTLEKYLELCILLLEGGCRIMAFQDYISSAPISNAIILRHDVDSKPNRALRMAKLESDVGIRSTYYFRHTKGVFNPEIIDEVQGMGHEVGYHYEVLSKSGGNYERAIKLFGQELEDFRKICDVRTACMHGSPLSKFDNRDLWKHYDFRDFGIEGEAYLSAGQNLRYFSDTGWDWSGRHKLRDLLSNGNERSIEVRSTDDLARELRNRRDGIAYVLIHPGNWAKGTYEWYCTLVENRSANTIKRCLKLFNNYEGQSTAHWYPKSRPGSRQKSIIK
jgi:hypothetical protein